MAEPPSQQALETNTLPPLENPYLDSSVFLAHIKKETTLCPDGRPRFELTTGIFNDAQAGKYTIFTSTVTIVEVRRIKGSTIRLTESERKEVNDLFKDFLEHEWIYPIEVNREIAEKAQDIGATYNLTPMDSIHVASAIWWGCTTLFAWDKKTLTSRIPEGVIEGVHIMEPYWEGIPPMPARPPPAPVN